LYKKKVTVAAQRHLASGNHSDLGGLTVPFEAWNPFSNQHSSRPFQLLSCPDVPAPEYPLEYPIDSLLQNWNPDSTIIPAQHFDSLCHFNYQTELHKAFAYRKAEVPFVVYNVPAVDQTVRRWHNMDFLSQKLGPKSYLAETSKSNHFMYWSTMSHNKKVYNRDGSAWQPPTGNVKVLFEKWIETAIKNHNRTLDAR